MAPIVASVAIWAFTQSPFAMVFALLGPIIAIASLGDAKRQGRKQRVVELDRFHRELETTRRAIAEAHARELDALSRSAPSAGRLLVAPTRDPERWRGSLSDTLPVTLGMGLVASGLLLEPGQTGLEPKDAIGAELDELRAAVAFLDRAPIVADARLGIGLCGSPALVAAAANAIIVQLANALPPSAVEFLVRPNGQWKWLALLPHCAGQQRVTETQRDNPVPFKLEIRPKSDPRPADSKAADSVIIAVAEHEAELPRECRVVVRLGGARSAQIVQHPEPQRLTPLLPEFISAEQARAFASLLREEAGGDAPDAGLPALVSFSGLTHTPLPGRDSLACSVGMGMAGAIVVDLVVDGPHAIIGGTTGSGKSELLVSWVLAMAASCSPEQLNFLLVDFKGGSSFQAVRDLPHSVGLVTDLDESAAHRAMLSLKAELRYREGVLSENAARSITELGPEVAFPRLVIVVDEFQALTASFPELHELFGDLAARGRSLGVHLILCTQRPVGVVRDAVLANCTLRMSLRVNNRADSVAVIGSPSAAELPRHPVGRALLAREDGECVPVQFALAGEQDADAVAARWAGSSWRPRRPWLDPLPVQVGTQALSPLPARGIAFGLADLPELQQQPVAVFDPDADGSLLVVGAHRAGKSGVLAAIENGADSARVRWVPGSVEGAWDAVAAILEGVRGGTAAGGLLLLDDLDALLGRFPEDYEQAFIDLLAALLREGSGAGLHLAISASRVTSAVQSIASLCESRLILRMPDRQEHLMAGGSTAEFDPTLPPGGGHWRGNRVQVVVVEPSERACAETAAAETAPLLDLVGWPGLAIVASAPQIAAERLRGVADITMLGPGAPPDALDIARPGAARKQILLGDPDAWQTNWGLIGRLRASVPVVFHGCSVAEFRTITRIRTLPPPITRAADAVWLLSPDGGVRRALLP